MHFHAAALLSLLALPLARASLQDQRPFISIPVPLSSPPLLGFGTWNLSPDDHNASASVSAAIVAGYRHIDCATAYGNQKDVGRGIKEGLEKTGLKREEIWVTSKLWNNAFVKIESRFDCGGVTLLT